MTLHDVLMLDPKRKKSQDAEKKHILDTYRALEDLITRSKNRLNPKALWDILTGIRGVDEDASEADRDKINHLTNHRVRAVTGLIPLHPNKPEKRKHSFNSTPLNKEERKKRDKYLESVPNHFRNHYKKAVDGVRDLYDWDLDDEKPVE
jgi:hypothetical protein